MDYIALKKKNEKRKKWNGEERKKEKTQSNI